MDWVGYIRKRLLILLLLAVIAWAYRYVQLGGINPAFSCLKHGFGAGTKSSFANKNFDVWYVPMDDAAFEALQRVNLKIANKLKITSVVAPCFNPSVEHFKFFNLQYKAEELMQALHNEYPLNVTVEPSSAVIAVTSEEMTIWSLKLKRAFAYREENFAIVSTARILDGTGQVLASGKFEERLRKTLMRNIGIQFFRYPLSNDSSSVLYKNVHTVEELDATQEKF